MFHFTPVLLVAAAALLGAVEANTVLNVNKGCIIVNSSVTICATPDISHDSACVVAGNTRIQACLDSNNQPHCELNVDIPMSWGEAYFGADNCLYSKGPNPDKLGCAS
ncbi:hypothetical protein BDV23DRAFT_182727 [Aspergillus alliaceus]|uniref:Uncharacterized protein n=1 Tax=Petromyces alliaceus TaxID=209559 RepID=A0A5N7CAN3_PETAA|nr:hypothetical protein BDV23DRAFT_182727 [Aspergillus alliaceus]